MAPPLWAIALERLADKGFFVVRESESQKIIRER